VVLAEVTLRFLQLSIFGHSGRILLCRFAYLYVFVCFYHLG
jgi:hypothetical protein